MWRSYMKSYQVPLEEQWAAMGSLQMLRIQDVTIRVGEDEVYLRRTNCIGRGGSKKVYTYQCKNTEISDKVLTIPNLDVKWKDWRYQIYTEVYVANKLRGLGFLVPDHEIISIQVQNEEKNFNELPVLSTTRFNAIKSIKVIENLKSGMPQKIHLVTDFKDPNEHIKSLFHFIKKDIAVLTYHRIYLNIPDSFHLCIDNTDPLIPNKVRLFAFDFSGSGFHFPEEKEASKISDYLDQAFKILEKYQFLIHWNKEKNKAELDENNLEEQEYEESDDDEESDDEEEYSRLEPFDRAFQSLKKLFLKEIMTMVSVMQKEDLDQFNRASKNQSDDKKIESFSKSFTTRLIKFQQKASLTCFDQSPLNANRIMAEMLSSDDLLSLPKTSQNFYYLFKNPFRNPFSQVPLPLKSTHQQLLECVIRGQEVAAEDILKKYPFLLLYKGTVADYSNRIINGTAYQMALGAEDVEMASMIRKFLVNLPNGKQEMIKQQVEQFPIEEKSQDSTCFKLLTTLTHVIHRAQKDEIIMDGSSIKMNDACEKALREFKDSLRSTSGTLITQGKHFNSKLLLEALELYQHYFFAFGGVNSPKNNLFLRQIIGYIQRFLPVSYAQFFCSRNYNGKLTRSLKFLNHRENVVFFPLDLNPDSRLGFDYAAWDGYTINVCNCPTSDICFLPLLTFITERNRQLQDLMQDTELSLRDFNDTTDSTSSEYSF